MDNLEAIDTCEVPLESLPILTKLKIILLGSSGVGKTSLLSQFVNGVRATDIMYTIGVEFKIKDIAVDGKRVRLALWDTAGQERFRSITQTYYRGVQGAVLVFDVTSRSSFSRLTEWMFELELYCKRDPVKLLVGNKADLEDKREVSKAEGMEFAKKYNILYMETSATTGDEVEYAFEVVTQEILAKEELWKQDYDRNLSVVKLGEDCLEWSQNENKPPKKRIGRRCC